MPRFRVRRERSEMTALEDIPVVILAGGLATRLRPITQTIPKAMVEVAGKPFIDHQLALLRREGVRKVVLCIGHLGEQLREHLGDGSRLRMQIGYSEDGPKLLGTGGALRRSLSFLDEACWVLYGDSYLDVDYRQIFSTFAIANALGLMTVLRNNDRWDKSNVVFRDGKLLSYDKKNTSPEMTHIDYGLAVLKREAIERIPVDEPHDLAALYHDLVSRGEMIGYEVSQRFYEIGSPVGLSETDAYLRQAA
jgi:NDP-sugar pyrophosphorylase family protein